MINDRRRSVIKSIGAAAVAVATPSLAATRVPITHPLEILNGGNGIDLSVVTEQAGGVSLTLTNQSHATASVRHVYPGIMQSRGRTFDINDMLANGPLSIGAGESVTVFMPRTAPTSTERAVPQGLTSSQSLKVSTLFEVPDGEQTVSTQRSYFS